MANTVLIVDDNRHLREVLAAALRHRGFGTVEAATGSEAIKKAISEKPDAIMVDLELPDMTGPQVALILKTTPGTKTIPIIGWTAYIEREYRDSALSAGMVDCLIKPIPLAGIAEKLQKFIFSER